MARHCCQQEENLKRMICVGVWHSHIEVSTPQTPHIPRELGHIPVPVCGVINHACAAISSRDPYAYVTCTYLRPRPFRITFICDHGVIGHVHACFVQFYCSCAKFES